MLHRRMTLPAAILALASCESPPEHFVPIPPERARAVVVRVGFRAAGSNAATPTSWRHLPLESLVRTSGPEAEALDRVISMLGSEPPRNSWPALRSYEIALRAGEPELLVIEDAGGGLPFTAMANADGKSVRAGVRGSVLTELLRKESYEALRASMTPPLRPLEWS